MNRAGATIPTGMVAAILLSGGSALSAPPSTPRKTSQQLAAQPAATAAEGDAPAVALDASGDANGSASGSTLQLDASDDTTTTTDEVIDPYTRIKDRSCAWNRRAR